MTIRLDVWADFVCPYCFLLDFALQELVANHDVDLHRHAFELRPADGPPVPEWYAERVLEARPQFEKTARHIYGVEVNSGPFGINSRPALVGYYVADAHGVGEAYHAAVLHAYWQAAQDISQTGVLKNIAAQVGLDADEFILALDDRAYQDAFRADGVRARMYGLTGVPALVFAGKYLVSGAQPYEALASVLAQVEGREAEAAAGEDASDDEGV